MRPRTGSYAPDDLSPDDDGYLSSASSVSRTSGPSSSPSSGSRRSREPSTNSPSPTRSSNDSSPSRSPSPPPPQLDSSPRNDNTHGLPQQPSQSDFFRVEFPGLGKTGKTFGKGRTSLEEIFANDPYADEREQNRFYPFSCETEWELAAWLHKARISTELQDEFFKLRYVRSTYTYA